MCTPILKITLYLLLCFVKTDNFTANWVPKACIIRDYSVPDIMAFTTSVGKPSTSPRTRFLGDN